MTNTKYVINYHLKNMNYILGNVLDNMNYDDEIERWYGKNDNSHNEENLDKQKTPESRQSHKRFK